MIISCSWGVNGFTSLYRVVSAATGWGLEEGFGLNAQHKFIVQRESRVGMRMGLGLDFGMASVKR